MAESLFSKVRAGVLGKLHTLVDDNIANTPDAYKQRIRELESALADLRTAVDEQVGTANGYRRQITAMQSTKAHNQADIDLLLGDNDPTNDDAALKMQVGMEDLDTQIASLQSLLDAAEANKAELQTAVDQLDHKHGEMVGRLNQITLSAAATSAQNRASKAAENALAASDAASGASVDSIQAKIDHDKDVADARFARVIGGMQDSASPEEAVKLARAKAAIEARRAQIANQASDAVPAAP